MRHFQKCSMRSFLVEEVRFNGLAAFSTDVVVGDCAKESNVIEFAIYDMNFFGHYLEETVGVATIRAGQTDLWAAGWRCGFHVLPRLLPRLRDRLQRSAPVLGRSKPGLSWHARAFRGLVALSRCCARGRAHSTFVANPTDSSVKALIRDLHGSAGTTPGHSWTVPAPRVKPGSTVTTGASGIKPGTCDARSDMALLLPSPACLGKLRVMRQ